MKTICYLTLSVIISFLGISAPAYSSDLIFGSNVDEIRTIGMRYAFMNERTTDKEGDPLLRGEMDGTQFNIFFYGCDSGTNCKQILFQAGWDLPNGVRPAIINNWNRGNLFGRAFLDDEGDPFVEMPINLDGGMSAELMDDNFDWWRFVLEEFKDHIGLDARDS